MSTVKGSSTSESGPSVPASGAVRDATPHALTMDIEMSAGAPQRIDLLHRTQAGGTFSGVTTWAGQNFGVQGQKQ